MEVWTHSNLEVQGVKLGKMTVGAICKFRSELHTTPWCARLAFLCWRPLLQQTICAATPAVAANQQDATTLVSIVHLKTHVEDVVALGALILAQLPPLLHRRLPFHLPHHLATW
jgi:hypothetical protein